MFFMAYAVEMKNISKRFPGVLANDNISFSVKRQEIHCLLGENGTGKTTLMNILFGLYKADEGSIYINGKVANIANSRIAHEMRIGMVHQHFMLVNRMSVLENIILGSEHGKYHLDLKESYEQVSQLAKKYKFDMDLHAKVEDLPVGMKQRAEILKTLYRGADIIILDEPTAVLTPQEVEELFVILRELKTKGKTIIFITHKLNETMGIADCVTVLRNGKNIVTKKVEETNPAELARYMVGRDVKFDLEKKEVDIGECVLSIKDLRLQSKAADTIDLEVHAGEIVGIAGVAGNGQTELEEIIMGLRKVKQGSVIVHGQDLKSMATRERRRLGIGYIPSDRHKRALLKSFSIVENVLLGFHREKSFVKNGLIQQKVLKEYSKTIVEDFNIKVADVEQSIDTLSGGNQQKVIVGREFSQDPSFILAAQPIVGLDVGAIEYIHELILKYRNEGKAILLISAELSEIMKLSDRIAVLYEGEIMDIRDAKDFDRESIGLLMAGKKGV